MDCRPQIAAWIQHHHSHPTRDGVNPSSRSPLRQMSANVQQLPPSSECLSVQRVSCLPGWMDLSAAPYCSLALTYTLCTSVQRLLQQLKSVYCQAFRSERDPCLDYCNLWALVIMHLHKTCKHEGSLQCTRVLFSCLSQPTCVPCPFPLHTFALGLSRCLGCPAFFSKASLSKLRDSAVWFVRLRTLSQRIIVNTKWKNLYQAFSTMPGV